MGRTMSCISYKVILTGNKNRPKSIVSKGSRGEESIQTFLSEVECDLPVFNEVLVFLFFNIV